MECYFFISKNFEKISCKHYFNLKNEIDLYGISKKKMSIAGSTCIEILNNFDKIICILKHCLELIHNPFYILEDYLRKELTNINKNLSDIIVYELNNYFVEEIDKIQKTQDNVNILKKSLMEHKNLLKNDTLYDEYYDKLIDDFKKDTNSEMMEEMKEYKNNKTKGKESICDMIESIKLEFDEALKEERNREEMPQLIENYIENLIENIANYKYYFDLYFGILNDNLLNGKSLDFFQATFSLEVEVPKFYIYNSYEDHGYIYPLKNLIFKLAEKEMKESQMINDEVIKTINNKSLNITKSLTINNEIIHCKLYKITSLKDILNIYLNFFIENNIIVNQCKNCGKYFIPESRTDEVYCNNKSPQKPNKTCKEYGAKKTYRESLKSKPIEYENNKTSQFYRMKINRAKTPNEKVSYEKKFTNYKERYQKKKEQYKSGKLKEDVFVKWIEKQKEIK